MISCKPGKDTRITKDNFDEVMSFFKPDTIQFDNGVFNRMNSLNYPTSSLYEYIESLNVEQYKEAVYLTTWVVIFSGYGTGWIGHPDEDEQKIEITLVTGGWSGNEDIIIALERIKLFNFFYKNRWERGGLYSWVFNNQP
jgi:hypothetical protein